MREPSLDNPLAAVVALIAQWRQNKEAALMARDAIDVSERYRRQALERVANCFGACADQLTAVLASQPQEEKSIPDRLSARWQELFWALPSGEMRSKLRALEIDTGRMIRQSSLPSVEGLIAYVQHKPECELGTGKLQPHPTYGMFRVHYGFGQILEGYEHNCGAQGYGMSPDDKCAGCDNSPITRVAICTCGLSQVLAEATPQEKKENDEKEDLSRMDTKADAGR